MDLRIVIIALYIPIDLWPGFEGNAIVRLFIQICFLGGHEFPY